MVKWEDRFERTYVGMHQQYVWTPGNEDFVINRKVNDAGGSYGLNKSLPPMLLRLRQRSRSHENQKKQVRTAAVLRQMTDEPKLPKMYQSRPRNDITWLTSLGNLFYCCITAIRWSKSVLACSVFMASVSIFLAAKDTCNSTCVTFTKQNKASKEETITEWDQ